ncbi:MAG TPA: hypothetical protein PL024_06680, partial [Thauera sp.]|nr:hypothetical protein [Thauera sp.]
IAVCFLAPGQKILRAKCAQSCCVAIDAVRAGFFGLRFYGAIALGTPFIRCSWVPVAIVGQLL